MNGTYCRSGRRITLIIVVCSAAHVMGCSGRPARLESQDFEIAGVVTRAMSEFDTNGDSKLDQSEMQAAPSLVAAQSVIDGDRDGAISDKELAARIEFWRASRVAVMPANCRVTDQSGQPVPNATVTFEPEPFLAGVLHEATGVTGRGGVASMSVAEEHRPAPSLRGVYCGLYRVRVSLIRDGKEIIDGRYNTQTTLGTEVYPNQVPQHDFTVSRR